VSQKSAGGSPGSAGWTLFESTPGAGPVVVDDVVGVVRAGTVVPGTGGGAVIGGTVSIGPVFVSTLVVAVVVVGALSTSVLVTFCVRTTVSISGWGALESLVLPTATPRIAPSVPPRRTPIRPIVNCWRAVSTPRGYR